MNSSLMAKVPSTTLPTILNFRDIGQTINILQGSPLLREGCIYRSARPDDASASDRTSLTSHYRIKTIVDLRSTTEHIDQAKKRNANANVQVSAVAPKNDEKATNVIKIPEIIYHEINLNGGAFARALLWKLRWSSLGKLVSLMALGYRTEATAILGREVMAPRGLIGLGKDTLDHGFTELHQIFTVIAEPSNGPILIHCAQGKDRTGLVVMLLLLLLDVPLPAVSADYVASERELQGEKEARMKETREFGLGEDFSGCPAGFVEELVKHIEQTYGGLEQYFDKVGIDAEMQTKIRRNLTQGED